MKDALLLARSPEMELRVAWRKRLVDHDGTGGAEGGIERWLRLAEATGLDRATVISGATVLPATRYAVDAYLDLVSRKSLLEAVASSLTEMFSRDLIALRMDRLREHYPWLAGRARLFSGAPLTSSRGRHLCARLGHPPCPHPGRAGAGHWRAARQVRHPVGPARRALLRLCAAGLASSGRFPNGGVVSRPAPGLRSPSCARLPCD